MNNDPILMRHGDTREDGPGGVLTIVRHVDYHPGDVHEMQPIESFSVYSGATGKLLLSSEPFGLIAGTARFADDGSLAMTIGNLNLTIDPAKQIWAMNHDDWRPHPLDGDQAKVDALVRPALKALHPPTAPSIAAKVQFGWMKARHWFELLLFAGAIGLAGWLLATYGWKPYSRVRVAEPTAVNAWLVTCPGIKGLMVFSVNPDGTLSAPPEISPARLSPVDGEDGRFALGGLAIDFDGREVIIERGGQSITCGPPAPPR